MRVGRVSVYFGAGFVLAVGAIGLFLENGGGHTPPRPARAEVAQEFSMSPLPGLAGAVAPAPEALVDPEALAEFQAANRATAGLPSAEEFERLSPVEQALVRAKLPPPPLGPLDRN